MDKYKTQIIQQSGGWIDRQDKKHYKADDPEIGKWFPDKGELVDDKDLEATTLVMIERKGGDEVRKNIESTRNALLALVDSSSRKAFETQMPLHIDEAEKNAEGEIKSWSQSNFEMMPTIASVTLLNKFQNDARNAETQILDYLYDR